MRGFLTLVIAVFAITGCATEIMSKEECLASDWYGAGLVDGAKGRLSSALGDRANLCAEFGAPPPDGKAYQQGREAALFRLCNAEGGFDYGRSGNEYLGVCRAEVEIDFLSGYLDGRRRYLLYQRVISAQSDYASAVDRIENTRGDIRRARRVIDDPEATEEDVAKAIERIKEARERLSYLRIDADIEYEDLIEAEEGYERFVAAGEAWGGDPEFYSTVDMLHEVYGFAREANTIDYCTDDIQTHNPTCVVRPGAAITDTASGAVCVLGLGEAELSYRRQLFEEGFTSGSLLTFDYYPEGSRSLFRSRASGRFDVIMDGEPNLVSISCAAGP